MNHHISFFKEAVKNWRSTGSIVRSSPRLIKKMMQSIAFEEIDLIVELGAGQGCITKALAQSLKGDTRLLALELNNQFFEELFLIAKENVEIIQGDALHLPAYVKKESVDVVVSGLPFANFSPKLKTDILEKCYESLKPNGLFIQFQYSLIDYKLLQRKFSSVEKKFTPLNIPPAFIYICRK
jgi:phospholipid N-methyltransferase